MAPPAPPTAHLGAYVLVRWDAGRVHLEGKMPALTPEQAHDLRATRRHGRRVCAEGDNGVIRAGEVTAAEWDDLGDAAYHVAVEDGTVAQMRAARARTLARMQGKDRADGTGLEPYDGDTAAERDREQHTDHGWGEDW